MVSDKRWIGIFEPNIYMISDTISDVEWRRNDYWVVVYNYRWMLPKLFLYHFAKVITTRNSQNAKPTYLPHSVAVSGRSLPP